MNKNENENIRKNPKQNNIQRPSLHKNKNNNNT